MAFFFNLNLKKIIIDALNEKSLLNASVLSYHCHFLYYIHRLLLHHRLLALHRQQNSIEDDPLFFWLPLPLTKKIK